MAWLSLKLCPSSTASSAILHLWRWLLRTLGVGSVLCTLGVVAAFSSILCEAVVVSATLGADASVGVGSGRIGVDEKISCSALTAALSLSP